MPRRRWTWTVAGAVLAGCATPDANLGRDLTDAAAEVDAAAETATAPTGDLAEATAEDAAPEAADSDNADSPGADTAGTGPTPVTGQLGRAVACAKLGHCMDNSWSVGFEACMNPYPKAVVPFVAAGSGIVNPGKVFLLDLDAASACLGAAKSCPAVWACLPGTLPGCPITTAKKKDCQGSVARACAGDTVLSADCARLGLACSMSNGKPFCGAICTGPSSPQCAGNTFKACLPAGGNLSVAISSDCSLVGAKCSTSGCESLGGACDWTSYKETCDGGKATSCDPEKQSIQYEDCAKLGMHCAPAGGSGGSSSSDHVACTLTPNCSSQPGCTDGAVQFCEGTAGLAMFPCAAAGMVCGSQGCVFPPP